MELGTYLHLPFKNARNCSKCVDGENYICWRCALQCGIKIYPMMRNTHFCSECWRGHNSSYHNGGRR